MEERKELILILDFFGQYNQLIARRIRECNVYSEIVPFNTPIEKIKEKKPMGIIFTGGHANVYKEDARKNKNMFPANSNFICFVDYNTSGNTTLVHGGIPQTIWNSYLHEHVGLKRIAWRNSTYFTRHASNIGRNDLCPCGSGKKFKKCCGK